MGFNLIFIVNYGLTIIELSLEILDFYNKKSHNYFNPMRVSF